MGSVKMSERDLEALRSGITEQVAADTRREIVREHMEKFRSKRSIRRVKLVDVIALKPGDVIVETCNGRYFQEHEVVARVAATTETGLKPAGDVWVTTNLGAQAMRYGDQILVEDRSAIERPACANPPDTCACDSPHPNPPLTSHT